MLKKLLPWFPVVVIVAVAVIGFGWPEKSQGDSAFKNVQVLTDLTPEQLQDYMADVTEALGVDKCTFCHVKDKSSDELEHKKVAREFMKLTRDINAMSPIKEGEKKVTCFTCHRGQEHPIHSAAEAAAAPAGK